MSVFVEFHVHSIKRILSLLDTINEILVAMYCRLTQLNGQVAVIEEFII